MNGFDNRDHQACPNATPPCSAIDGCIATLYAILAQTGDHLATYSARYYEIYKKDILDLTDAVAHLHALFNPAVP